MIMTVLLLIRNFAWEKGVIDFNIIDVKLNIDIYLGADALVIN